MHTYLVIFFFRRYTPIGRNINIVTTINSRTTATTITAIKVVPIELWPVVVDETVLLGKTVAEVTEVDEAVDPIKSSYIK